MFPTVNNPTAYDNLTPKTIIYYNGDRANNPGFGYIAKVNPPNRFYKVTYEIRMGDGRLFRRVLPNSFHGLGHRFELFIERKAKQRARFNLPKVGDVFEFDYTYMDKKTEVVKLIIVDVTNEHVIYRMPSVSDNKIFPMTHEVWLRGQDNLRPLPMKG